MYQLNNYFNIRIYIIPIWFYFNQLIYAINFCVEFLYIPIWFYFNCSHLSCKLSLNVLYIPIWFYFNEICILPAIIAFKLYIPIWFYFNNVYADLYGLAPVFTFQYGSTLINANLIFVAKAAYFTFQYGSTLIHSCQFRIFFMLICSFLSTSLYLFYFPIHFIMFFIKKPLIPFIYIPLSTSSHFYFIEHRQNFSLLIYIIYKFNFIISHFIISTLHNFNFFAWTQIN